MERVKTFHTFFLQAVSQFPQCINDLSFWVPNEQFDSNDFYEIVRDVGGDIVEQVMEQRFYPIHLFQTNSSLIHVSGESCR